jgi:hypothetical protein
MKESVERLLYTTLERVHGIRAYGTPQPVQRSDILQKPALRLDAANAICWPGDWGFGSDRVVFAGRRTVMFTLFQH